MLLTGQASVELGHLPFPTGLLPLLVPDLPLGSLVAEDLDLAVGAVNGLVAAVVVAVGVDLQVQGETLHTFLRREVCAQTVDRDENLWRDRRWQDSTKTGNTLKKTDKIATTITTSKEHQGDFCS